MKRVILITIVISILLSGCSSSNGGNKKEESFPGKFNPELDFRKCGILECSFLSVPMDYEDLGGRKISLNIVKKPAAKPEEKIGVILVNPGGPGVPGASFVENTFSFIFPQEILDRFDIIGWDPRGAGSSSGVICNRNLDPLFDDVDYSSDLQSDKDKVIEASKWIGQECAREDRELLPHLTTENTVLDLEAIRVALGEKEINYLGYSYGSAIGQRYLTKFTDKVRTMVLDGITDLTIEPEKLAIEQSLGFESAVNSFFEYCKRERCTFSGSRDPKQAYLDIMKKVKDSPIASRTDATLTLGPAHLDVGVAQYLYSGENGWKILDRGLTEINRGVATTILDGFSQYTGRSAEGKYDGKYISFLSIGCSDGKIGDTERMFDMADDLREEAPIFGASGILLGLPCALWPDNENNLSESFKLDVKDSNPIVIIGTTGDPATPVQWSRNVAKQIENSVFIEKVGEGHTIYGNGDLCIDNAVNNYFLTGVKPKAVSC